MKKILVVFSIALCLCSCVKNEELTPVVQAIPPVIVSGTQESVGTFTNGAHAVSGTVKVVADKTDAKKKYLSFENFKTDAGPDLYIYLAEDKAAKGYISVVKLDKTGTFSLEVPTNADLTKQKYVLIWCQQFTVLFGSARLE